MKTLKLISKMAFLVLIMSMSLQVSAQEKKEPKTFIVERIIPASADSVWRVVGEDYGAVANSHPQIVSSDYVNGSLKSGEGAERVCNLNEKGTKYVKEKQINYDPANYTFTAQIYHVGNLPLVPEVSFATYKVEPIDENSCKLSLNVGLMTKPAFMAGLARGRFKKTLEDYLLAVEHHVITGENVNKDNFKEIKKQYAD